MGILQSDDFKKSKEQFTVEQTIEDAKAEGLEPDQIYLDSNYAVEIPQELEVFRNNKCATARAVFRWYDYSSAEGYPSILPARDSNMF